jgi:type II secretory pathway component GspD/PulD (secretin)
MTCLAFLSKRVLGCAVLVAAIAATGRSDDNAQAPQSLAIQMTLVRVNATKFKNLGFIWSQLLPDGRQSESSDLTSLVTASEAPEKLAGFLEALRQNSLATVLAEPTIVTLDGRTASLKVGGTQLDVVPIVRGDGRVHLECRLEYEYENGCDPVTKAPSKAQLVADSSVILPLGKTFVLGHSPSSESKDGTVTEYHTIVLATVTRSDELAQKSGQSDLK